MKLNELESNLMQINGFLILYASDGTYSILEEKDKKPFHFSIKRKKMSYDEMLNYVQKLRQNEDRSSTAA
tara:strand:- start:119276 stop:119485 length:210 start_codon:yes stop_codon:yes gene_type:complete